MGQQGSAFTVFVHESLELVVPIGTCVKKYLAVRVDSPYCCCPAKKVRQQHV